MAMVLCSATGIRHTSSGMSGSKWKEHRDANGKVKDTETRMHSKWSTEADGD